MKLAIREVDVTPLKPCMQCGYVQRDHVFEKVHDPIQARIFVLTIAGKKHVWVGTDLTAHNQDVLDLIIDLAKSKGVDLNCGNFILGASHNHSAPALNLDPDIASTYGLADPVYVAYFTRQIADLIVSGWNDEGVEVTAKASSAMIDGLYSNRNDANKLSDKVVHLIGFFDLDDKPVGVYTTLACHNTVLGPNNYELTGELFAAIRRELEEHYHCPVLMAQGDAGDMGNRQYRTGQSFKDLDLMSRNICQQILRKKDAWTRLDLEPVSHQSIVYKAEVTLDSSIYDARITDYQKKLETETDLTNRKVMLSGIEGFRAKQKLGNGLKVFDMPAEIFSFGQLQIVCVPGELGSYLGLMIKKASKAQECIVWGYTGPCDLGYIVDKEAFDMECQETNTTKYPKGVGEDFVDFIISNL